MREEDFTIINSLVDRFKSIQHPSDIDAMPKLNKTERDLLSELSEKKQKGEKNIVLEHMYGQGSEGGSFSSGSRRLNAALSLIEKGLVKEIDRQHYTSSSGGGYNYSGTILTIGLKNTLNTPSDRDTMHIYTLGAHDRDGWVKTDMKSLLEHLPFYVAFLYDNLVTIVYFHTGSTLGQSKTNRTITRLRELSVSFEKQFRGIEVVQLAIFRIHKGKRRVATDYNRTHKSPPKVSPTLQKRVGRYAKKVSALTIKTFIFSLLDEIEREKMARRKK